MHDCKQEAYATVQWSGPSGRTQTANFCKEHSQELWTKMKGHLNTGTGTWSMWPPEEVQT